MNDKFLKWAAALLGLVGILWAGYTTVDERYARAADVQQRFEMLDKTLKQGQRQQLRREETEYLQKGLNQGGLTIIEKKRLQEVQDEIQAIDRDLGGRKEKP